VRTIQSSAIRGIAGRGATPSIPPREGAKPWSEGAPGASWRNEAIDDIVRDGRDEWKKHSGYHRRSLIENTMYRYKTRFCRDKASLMSRPEMTRTAHITIE
jgi:hypothetical protein